MMVRFLSALIVMLFLVVGESFAQTPPPAGGATFKLQDQQVDPRDTDRRMMTARQLIRQQNYEAAAALLEVVYESNPDNSTVINLLKSCYAELKQYGKAETLIRRSIAQVPQNLMLRLELAEMLSNQGYQDSAMSAYHEVLGLITDKDRNKYLMVIRSQLSHGLDDAALNLIASLRKDLKDTSLFALERGSVLENQRKYRDALKEYIPLLAQDTTHDAMEVERRLELLLEFPESSPEVEKLLVAESNQRQNRLTIQLLADYYLRANRFDQALTYAVKRDSLEGGQGNSLIYLMRQCYERKLYNETVRMGKYILPRSKTGPGFMEASMLYARALGELGRAAEAKAVYDTVFATSPREVDKADALYGTGAMYFDNQGDFAKALVYFDSVVNRYPFGQSYMQALRARPFCYLGLGDLAATRKALVSLKERPLNDEISEETQYYLGLVDFFENNYDSAETAFRKLMVDHPTGFYVNDALQLVMVLTEAKDSPELLADYATALWFLQRNQLDSSRAALERIAKAETNSLADVALYKLTTINLEMNDSTAALQSIDQLDKEFPDSYYRPYGLKLKADMLCTNRNSIEQAKTLYKQILEQFPNYPFASEVRKKLRQLETDFKVG